MFKRIVFSMLVAVVGSYSLVQAAPIDLPAGVDNPQGAFFKSEAPEPNYRGRSAVVDRWLDNVSLSFSAGYERVEDREFDGLGAEKEGKVFSGKAAVSFYNKFDIYGIIGQTDDFEYRARIDGANVIFNLKDEVIWGGGVSGVLYDWQDGGVKLFFDAKYRQMEDASYSFLYVDNVRFGQNELTDPTRRAKYREWQGALGISAQIGRFIPYLGASYSDTEIKARATAGGTDYDIGTLDNDVKIGPFCGLAINPFDGLSLKGQARFLDGQAFSGSAMLRF